MEQLNPIFLKQKEFFDALKAYLFKYSRIFAFGCFLNSLNHPNLNIEVGFFYEPWIPIFLDSLILPEFEPVTSGPIKALHLN